MFFLLTTKYLTLYWNNHGKVVYAEMLYGDIILTLQLRHRLTCGQHAAVHSLSFSRDCTGMIGKNNGNPDLVCEKNCDLGFSVIVRHPPAC